MEKYRHKLLVLYNVVLYAFKSFGAKCASIKTINHCLRSSCARLQGVETQCNIIISKFSFILIEICVHMSLLNILIYIAILCVPVTIYFNNLKYLSHLSWSNMSDIYLT
jgi:hypothetical protein